MEAQQLEVLNSTPEIFLSVITSGGHCCMDSYVFDSTPKKDWEALEVAMTLPDDEVLEDTDKDGQLELITPDQAFYGENGYPLAKGAYGLAPLKIWSVDHG